MPKLKKLLRKLLYLFFSAPQRQARKEAAQIIAEAHARRKEIERGGLQIKPNHEIELAFVSGGKPYYKFVNEQNIPVMRAFKAMDVYNELEMRIDREYLLAFFKTTRKILEHRTKLDLPAIVQLIVAAEGKMKHITNIDTLYRLASVLYIAENEDPYNWDYEFAEKKIEHWRKNSDVESFFLHSPMSDFLPSFHGLPAFKSWDDFHKAQQLDQRTTYELMLSSISAGENESETRQYLSFLVETLQKQMSLKG
jgi:hypothetical protein